MAYQVLKPKFHTDLVDDNEGIYGGVYDLRYDPKNGGVELVNIGIFANRELYLFL